MKKQVIFIVMILVVVGVYWGVQNERTRVAFVNYQGQYLEELELAKDNFWIEVFDMPLKTDDFSDCSSADMVLLNHIGHMTEDQKSNLEVCMKNGVKVHVTMATSPDYKLSNFKKSELDNLMPFLEGSGSKNQKEFLNYVRAVIDGKSIGVKEIEKPQVHPSDVFYRLGEEYWTSFDDYKKYYSEKGLLKKDNPWVVVSSAGSNPQTQHREPMDVLIEKLEAKAYNVVSIAGWKKKLDLLKAVNPVAVINMPHGRLDMTNGDAAVEWLKKNNILYFTPQHIGMLESDWRNDKRGMFGGLLSQNIVVPEIDGGIGAYVISAEKLTDRGFAVPMALVHRIDKYVQVVDQWLSLRKKKNSEKKAVIYFYKGVGQNALVAGGLEVGESLFNMLKSLKDQGYDVGDMPKDSEHLLALIQKHAAIYSVENSPGAFYNSLEFSKPDYVSTEELSKWLKEEVPQEKVEELLKYYGSMPGKHYVSQHNGKESIVIPNLKLGNIYLTPVMPAALGESDFAMIHGVEVPPPYSYVTSYLWSRKRINADVIFHMGAHGSVEFIPGKQVSTSEEDWVEVLTYPVPHLYVYSVDNIGEAMMAKRRSYATMLSHLTPAMSDAELDDQRWDKLDKLVHNAEESTDSLVYDELKNEITKVVNDLRLYQDLGWSDFEKTGLSKEHLQDLCNYIHHLKQERIPVGLHEYGESYSDEEIDETVFQMSVSSLHAALKENEYFKEDQKDHNHSDRDLEEKEEELEQTKIMVTSILRGEDPLAYFSQENKIRLQILEDSLLKSKSTRMLPPSSEMLKLRNLKNELLAVKRNEANLKKSGDAEIDALLTGLKGGYIGPSSGGDVVGNPDAAPTGRNLYSINADQTPSKVQWEVAKKLGDEMLNKYLKKHGVYPKKMAFSLWGGEFIRNQGMNVAQILYLLGVEPVRNARGRVYDVKLIPMEKLGRPRIDIVVQTSGQFRDIGGSRIEIIQKAIDLVVNAPAEDKPNYAADGTKDVELDLKAEGYSPEEAQKLSRFRVFGGLNGSYGTGIMGLVENGEKWDTQDELADRYLNNMGATYNDDNWGEEFKTLFTSQLKRTDVVVHPRSSNATGPISLDHVYEFMGGISASVQRVTGKDPEAYFNDNRNKFSPKTQGLKEAIWTEARTTILNRKYIKEWMNEGPTAAESMAENVRNTFGWNALKPSSIDSSLWHAYYDVYIQDSLKMGVNDFFEKQNPYAFQEMTGVMLESVRKGLWNPDSIVVSNLAKAHANSIEKFGAGCSEFVCGNSKLIDFIQNSLTKEMGSNYKKQLSKEIEVSEKNREKAEVILEKTYESKPYDTEDSSSKWKYLIILFLLGLFLLILWRQK